MVQIAKQLRILDLLVAHLQGITPANEYNFDLSNRVHMGRVVFGVTEPAPYLSIIESPQQDDPAPADLYRSYVQAPWRLWVQGWAAVGKDEVRDLYELKACVEKRLAGITLHPNRGGTAETFMLGNTIADIIINPGIVRPADPRTGTEAFFYTPIVLRTVLNFNDPFLTVSE